MPNVSINSARINVQRNIGFEQGYFKNAVRKTNVRSKVRFQQIAQERNELSPQDISQFANRISMQANASRSVQDRFVDTFV